MTLDANVLAASAVGNFTAGAATSSTSEPSYDCDKFHLLFGGTVMRHMTMGQTRLLAGALVTPRHAQHGAKNIFATAFGSRNMRITLVLILALSVPALAQQSIVEGKSTVNGSTVVNSLTSQYVSIFVVNPPNPTVNTTFVPNVMIQDAIDGVTLPLVWANIEGSAPNTTPCTPAPSDTCQPDPVVPMYHHYDWSTYESTTFPGVWGWFAPVGPSPGVAKTVNFILDGETAGMLNAATPHYVTDSSWYSLFVPPYTPTTLYAQQDVINSVNCSSLNEWTGTTPSSLTYSATPSPQVTVHSTGCCSSTSAPNSNVIQTLDLVWVSVPSNSACGTGSTGMQATATDNNHFYYTPQTPSSCSNPISTTNATFIAAFQSWAVPYEWPYKSALKALWAATFAHFSSTYTVNWGAGNTVVAGQLGYIRPGESVGGEAYPYCTSGLPTSGPYQYSTSVWESYYSEMLQWAQSQTPFMTFFAPLNSTASYDFGTYEAGIAATTTNGHGVIDGFGSQGLSLLDTTAFNGCSGSTSNWCDSFSTWNGMAMPRELQQLSLSNEQNQTSCPGCGTPPSGNSGDLYYWLPFAVENHMTVLELYTLDAGLAFDPNYCANITSPPLTCFNGYPVSGTFLNGNSSLQATFMNDVGQGYNCPNGGPSYSTGGCQYAQCITDAHGLHPRPQSASSCMPY